MCDKLERQDEKSWQRRKVGIEKSENWKTENRKVEQKDRNSETRKIGRKIGKSENRKIGKQKNQKQGN
jgi:hypothetical protein